MNLVILGLNINVGAVVAVLALIAVLAAVVLRNKRKKKKSTPQTPQAPQAPQAPQTSQNSGRNVILSQDGWDEDNYMTVSAALQAHKRGLINLLAVDITGQDLGNKASQLFRALMHDVGVIVPIIVNHNRGSRSTPTSSRYKPQDFKNDGVLDSQRPGIPELLQIIRKSSGDIYYVVGGHVTNLETMLRTDKSIVQAYFKEVVISSGWDTRKFKQETNLSGDKDASNATEFVWKHLPQNVQIVMIDNAHGTLNTHWNFNALRPGSVLKTLIKRGPYFKAKHNKATMGDFDALMYGISSLDWHGNKLFEKRHVTLLTNGTGRIKVHNPGSKPHYLLTQGNKGVIRTIAQELLQDS